MRGSTCSLLVFFRTPQRKEAKHKTHWVNTPHDQSMCRAIKNNMINNFAACIDKKQLQYRVQIIHRSKTEKNVKTE